MSFINDHKKILMLLLMPLYSFAKFRVHPLPKGLTIFDTVVIILLLLIAGANI